VARLRAAARVYIVPAMTTRAYRDALRALLRPAERRLFARLDTPQKIQDFLDRLPANFEPDGATAMSPRRMLQAGVAHCAEGALFAVAALYFHGRPAWLLDLRALPRDQDHIVALFKERGLWGAVSKTNHSVLRWRDPIYRSVRELAMSYAHEYCLPDGRKSLMEYSRPFALTRYAPERWLVAEDDLDWLMDALDAAPHLPVAPAHAMRRRRPSSPIELDAQKLVEWRAPQRGQRRLRPRRRSV
jgi:hypothetical protein